MKTLRKAILILPILLTLMALNAAAVSLTETHHNVTCPKGNDGSITITTTGGTAPYTYVWNDAVTSQNRTNIIAGLYTVIVTDFAGQTTSLSINVTEPPHYVFSKIIVSENCGGDSIGSVDFGVTGGVPPYTYLWSNGATTQDLANLTAAVYYCTVTDGIGCTTLDSANVTQPPGVAIVQTTTNSTCGLSNGAITTSVLYGNPGYTYNWNDGNHLPNRTGLAVGTYQLTVTDTIGCTATATMNVAQTPVAMTINTTTTKPSCFGGSNGSITITSVVGSAGPYGYLWNTGATTTTITGCSATTYTVTVTNGIGCTASQSFTLTQPTAINITINTIPVSCYGGNDGALVSNVSGGTSGYTYNWGSGYTGSFRTSATAGTYTLTVTDSKACTATASASLSEPTQVVITATANPVTCSGGASGSITTSTTGGTPGYTYWWGSGIITSYRNSLSAGTYCVTATDANGCSASACGTVSPYVPLNLASSQIDPPCYNGSNGGIALSITQGWIPYTYIWSTGATAKNVNGLSSGTYTVTVTDNHGCNTTQTFNVNQPAFPVTINSTIQDVNCFGDSTASISLWLTYATMPATYTWNDGSTASSKSGLPIGTYSVQVTDSNGCTASGSYTITQPPKLTITLVDSDVTCFGNNNGKINTTVTGGFPPYTYDWGTGLGMPNRNNLSPGTYNLNLHDNYGCTATASATITQPALLTATATPVNASCNGTATGAVNLTVNGGTTPYTYNWSNTSTTANLNAMGAANYSVAVTDNSGCTASAAATVNEPTAITITSTTTNVTCNGGNTGTINVSVSGGTAPYTYDWGNNIHTQNRTALGAGTYIVTVTDNNGCSATKSSTIGQNSTLSVSATSTNVSCFGGANGAINVTVTGGTTPYTFDWGNSIYTQNRTALTAGNYTLTVTDNMGCNVTSTTTITEPAAITITAGLTNPTCYGAATGAIATNVTGGTTPYNYSWTGSITTPSRSSVGAGTYALTVTDNAGCTATNAFTLTQPIQISVSTTSVNPTCNGTINGSITASATGGTGTLTYAWPGPVTGATRNGIGAGTYVVTVTDANSCSATSSATLTQPAAMTLSLTKTDATCYTEANGTINATVTGGTAGYTYSWSNSSTAQNISGLAANSYSVVVTDSHLCTVSGSTTINQPTQLAVNIASAINPGCSGTNSGSVSIGITGGTPGYTYLWSNSTTTQNLNGIGAGTYTVNVSDANSCSASASATLTQAGAINVSTTSTNVNCFGNSTGAATVSASGGSGGFTYIWSNNATTATITGVNASTYTVTVKDAANCSVTTTATITQPAQIVVTPSTTNIICNGQTNGAITIATAGGNAPYTYDWGNNIHTQNRTALGAGTYNLTVTDANTCSSIKSVTITQPSAIAVNHVHTDYACTGTKGTITATVTGGTTPYQYTWNDGAHTASRSGLNQGLYVLQITDANGCTATAQDSISRIPDIITSITKTNVTCFAYSNGSAHLAVSGGQQPYSFLWDNQTSAKDRYNLPAGVYHVLVTDYNNCSVTDSTIITQPDEIGISETIIDVSCFGKSDGAITTRVQGGVSPFTYSWSNTATTQDITNIPTGTYSVVVTDAFNCTAALQSIVAQPAQIIITANATNIGCGGNDKGSIDLTVTGGRQGYTYSWSNTATTKNINDLNIGDYIITVTDLNNCTAQKTVSITATPPLVLTLDPNDAACKDVNNGSITADISGGTGNYSYTWNNSKHTKDIDHIGTGTYTLTVTDAGGCSTTASASISTLYDLEVSASGATTIKDGESATVTAVANQNHNNSYTWLPSLAVTCDACPTATVAPQTTTLYTVVVKDANGCTAKDTVTIEVTEPGGIYVPNAFSPNGDGANDVFEVYGDLGSLVYFEVAIYDRWGEKVFESNDHHFQWNGEFKGEPAQIGNYVYTINAAFINGQKHDYKGSVLLLR